MAVKTVQGVAEASVKTVLGVANASVKTVMGVDMGGGTTPQWFDAVTLASAPSNENSDSANIYVQPVTVGSGNATKLRFGLIFDNSTSTLGGALHDTSGNLLASGEASTDVGDNAYIEVTIASTAVTAGVYWVAFMIENTNASGLATLTSQPLGSSFINFSGSFASFPYDPLPSLNNLPTLYAVGVYVE